MDRCTCPGRRADLKRGDIYMVPLDPTLGHEQQGRRPVLIVSPDDFNAATKLPVVLPITSGGDFARRIGFAVPLARHPHNRYRSMRPAARARFEGTGRNEGRSCAGQHSERGFGASGHDFRMIAGTPQPSGKGRIAIPKPPWRIRCRKIPGRAAPDPQQANGRLGLPAGTMPLIRWRACENLLSSSGTSIAVAGRRRANVPGIVAVDTASPTIPYAAATSVNKNWLTRNRHAPNWPKSAKICSISGRFLARKNTIKYCGFTIIETATDNLLFAISTSYTIYGLVKRIGYT